jgi:mannosyl-3-phosphoglycerate phosphatase
LTSAIPFKKRCQPCRCAEQFRVKLDNDHPFISENGGGIFIPKQYFRLGALVPGIRIQEEENFSIIKLGASYNVLRTALSELRDEGFDITGFGDMNVHEVAELTGLDMTAARLAKERDFDEPFIVSGSGSTVSKLTTRIREKGFQSTQGEYFHIMGDSDKGRAVEILKGLYSEGGNEIITAALGDSPNDIEMLRCVDFPFVVQKRDGSYHPQVVSEVEGIHKAAGVGPEGWNTAVIEMIRLFM